MRLIPKNRTARPCALSQRPGRGARVLLALSSVLALLPLGAIALFQLGPDTPSPATGHAQVIAQGVSAMPAARLAWRIVQDTAEPRDQAVPEERALGFTLADQQAILVYDQRTAGQTRLAGGEASFVPAGSLEQRSSLSESPAPYYRFALVPAEQATEAGGDRLIFGGDAWNAPAGEQFDLDLVRDVVDPNEASTIPAGNAPTLVLATSGTIEVEAAGAAPVRIDAGEAGNFTGQLSILGIGASPAAFVAAVVGPEVPLPPAPPTGSITISVLGCPADLSPTEAVAASFAPEAVAGCQPVALPTNPTLILAGNQPLEPDQPNPGQGTYTWNSLLYSPFPVADFELPSGYDAYLLVNANGIVKASENASVGPSVADPDVLFVNATEPNAQATLFLFADEAGAGSISLAPFACPEGMTAETFASERCQPATIPFEIGITSVATGATRATADALATSGNPFLTWDGLPTGDYTIEVSALPTEFTAFVIPGLEPDPVTGVFTVQLTDAVPDAQFNVFFLQPGDAEAEVGGAISVTVLNCPPGMGRDTLVPASCQPSTGFELNLYPPTGGALGLAEASVQGNMATWSDLPFATYAIEEVVLPPGYVDAYAPEVPISETSDRVYITAISESTPQTAITIYNFQVPASAPVPTQTPTGDG